MKRVVEIREGRRSILDFQPAVSDHLRYEPLTGRIAIATRSRRLRETYKRLLGDMLAGDESFFSDANVCNLRPLQVHGAQLFERDLPPEILRIAVTDLHWQRGDRDRLSVRGRDCFKVLDDLGARLHEGTLTDAKLRFFFAGDPPRADVLLRAPNRIEISGSGFRDELVRRVLSDLGILGAAAGSFASLDTWSLFPYRHHSGLWRQRLGTRFDAAIAGGVLRSITLESVAHPDTPDVPGQLTIERLPDGQRIGVSLDPPALRTLTPTDYLGYELNWNAVANAIVQATDLTGSPRAIEPWLWALGTRALGSADVCVFMAIRRPPPEAELVMAEHAGGARVVVVAPEDCTYRSGVFAIVKADPFGSTFDDVLPRIVTQLGLQHEVPIWLWCRQDLILDITTNRAWFRRRELASLALQPFKFAVALADARGRVVAKHLLNEQLSPSRPDDAAARQAKAAFVKALRSSHEVAGVPCPTEDIFPSQSGGYFVNCSHYVHRATAAETAQ